MLGAAPRVWPLSSLVARPYSLLDVALDIQATFSLQTTGNMRRAFLLLVLSFGMIEILNVLYNPSS